MDQDGVPTFVTDLTGIPLTEPLGVDDTDALQTAFDLGIVVVRAPGISEDEHDRFVQVLGELHTFPWGEKVEYMSNVVPKTSKITGNRELLFHTDGIYGEFVAPGTSLFALDVSETSPPTLFIDCIRAYEVLEPELKEVINGLHAFNTFDTRAAESDVDPHRFLVSDHPDYKSMPHVKTAVHPVVIEVPQTGRKALFVNEFNTSHIVELGPTSSVGETILQTLFAALYDEAHRYAHYYQNGDMVIWNNLSTQHARPARIDTNPRTFRRVVLKSLRW